MISERAYARDVTAEDIRELLAARAHETNELEFKEAVDSDLIKAACGIANAGGGYLLVGVKEDTDHCAASLVDIPNPRNAEDSIRQRLRDGLAPRPLIEVVGLEVGGISIIVIRVSPQNPPHMVSADKKTDFFGRYDATTEKMRYEEIEQRFREKHRASEAFSIDRKRVEIETVSGRRGISLGAFDALARYVSRIRETNQPTLAFLAVSEGNKGSMSEAEASRVLSAPLYHRDGGWLVAHRTLEVSRDEGAWVQRYGSASTTTINPSGDFVFLKAVDEILCWRQEESAFKLSARFYPNALIEYCLSFAYSLVDIAARTLPENVYVKVVLGRAGNSTLPLGEGGSVWFDSPVAKPKKIESDFLESYVMAFLVDARAPISPRNLAFLMACEIYGFFGYSKDQVAFAADGEIMQESDPDTATLTSIRTFLESAILVPFDPPMLEFDRRTYWLRAEYAGKHLQIGVGKAFVEDNHTTEAELFSLLRGLKIGDRLRSTASDVSLVISNEGLRQST